MDLFSAGGKVRIVDGRTLKTPLPKVVKTLRDKFDRMKPLLEKDSPIIDFIHEYNPTLLRGNIYEEWLAEVAKELPAMIEVPIKSILENKLELK